MKTYTHIEDDDWEHRCERMPNSSLVQFRLIGMLEGWHLILPYGITHIAYCPYCGIELEKMPKQGGKRA